MNQNEIRVPISARVRKSLRTHLEREAKTGGLTLAELIEQVLEDYQRFLSSK